MNRLILVLATIFLTNAFSWAQEQLGMRTSNYAGANGLTLNPASSLTNPFSWDVNLLEFGQFFDNNYLFVENFRLLDAPNLPALGALRPDLKKGDLPTPTDRFVIDFYRSNGSSFRGDVLTSAMGPALMLRLGDYTTVGFFTRARAAFNARDVPSVLGYYEYNEQPFDAPFEATPFKLDAMVWSEIGLNYARISDTDYGQLSIGGTLKLLQGYEVGYARLEQPMTFMQVRGNRLVGEPGRASYAFASSLIDLEEGSDWQLQQNGVGAGLDLGLAFTILGEDEDYRWKFGFSLLDLGVIRYNKSAEQHLIVVGDSTSLNFNQFDFENEVNLDSIIKEFSRQTLKDPNASLQGRAFGMWLPTALSAQAEVRLASSLFVNATIVQGIPLNANAIRRNSVAALTPRFERRWLEAALPITLLDWKRLRSGLAVRLGFLWLGTEDLGSVFSKGNFDSTDFYMAFKINPFQLNINKNKDDKRRSGYMGQKQPKIKARSNGGVKCPKF